MQLFDISIPVQPSLAVWPGDTPFALTWNMRLENGDSVNISTVTMSVHTGTHMDAPLHFIRGARTIDQMPLDATIGPARVIEIRDPESIKREELLAHDISPGERILFKTANSAHAWNSDEFDENFVFIALNDHIK